MTRRAGSIIAVLCAVAALAVLWVVATQGGPDAAQDPSPPTVAIERGIESAKVPADRANAPAPAQQLAVLIPAGGTLAQFREQLRAMFYQADADGDGVLTEADASLHRAVTAATWVVTGVVQIMIADLDGDGFVTEAELRRKLRYDQHRESPLGLPRPPSAQGAGDPDRRIQQEVARLMAADADRDGRISWIEAAAFARRQADQAPPGFEGPVKAFRALAPGKDRIALADVDGIAEAVFGEIDADHNGTVSTWELAAWQARQARHNR